MDRGTSALRVPSTLITMTGYQGFGIMGAVTGDPIIFRDLGVLVRPPDAPGPKLYLRRVNDEEEKNDAGM
jgi:hypothetical protein